MRKLRTQGLKEMLEIDPQDCFALYGLAMEHKHLEENEEAINLLIQLLEVDPDHLYTYYQLGELLLKARRREEALNLLNEGVRRAEMAGEQKATRELESLRRLASP